MHFFLIICITLFILSGSAQLAYFAKNRDFKNAVFVFVVEICDVSVLEYTLSFNIVVELNFVQKNSTKLAENCSN